MMNFYQESKEYGELVRKLQAMGRYDLASEVLEVTANAIDYGIVRLGKTLSNTTEKCSE